MEQFWARLGSVADVTGLVTLVVSILTYLKVQRETQKLLQSLAKVSPANNLEQQIQLSREINTLRPVALAFSLTPTSGSIESPVQNFLQVQGWQMPIETVEMDGISSDQASEFYQKVRQKKRELELKGYTEVHLFFSGPVQAGTIVGCLFSNWLPVKLYQWVPPAGRYEYWMPLLKA